jgi:death on curing protein
MTTTPDPIRFLDVNDVLHLHANTITHEGGNPGLRDMRLLESALATPRQQFAGHYLHANIAAMAAAYLFHIVQNHPFIDGNKRTGALATLLFLDANGFKLPPARELERVVMAVAAGKQSKADLIEWFKQKVADRPKRSTRRPRKR